MTTFKDRLRQIVKLLLTGLTLVPLALFLVRMEPLLRDLDRPAGGTPHNFQFTLNIKSGRDAVIRLSKNAWNAIRAYHRVRADLDTKSGPKPEQLPVFAQHSRLADLNAKRKRKTALVRPWTEAGARQILEQANKEVFGEDYRRPDPDATAGKRKKKVLRGRVTPHGLRRYFVCRIYNRHHDLRKAQLLARHCNMTTTQRYIGTTDMELEEA